MMTTKGSTKAVKTTERFLIPNLSGIDEPAYDTWAEMLEEVKRSNKRIYPIYLGESVYIAENVKDALTKANVSANQNVAEYYKIPGVAHIQIWDVARFCIRTNDGWSQNFIEAISRVACKVVLSLLARSVHVVVVQDGVFYCNEESANEAKEADVKIIRDMKLVDFDSRKFRVQGVLKKVADYEPGNEFIVFRKEFNDEWRKYMSPRYPSLQGGYIEDEFKVLGFSCYSPAPVVFW